MEIFTRKEVYHLNDIICRTVQRLIKKYQTRNPFEIAEALNIEVQIGSPGCDGCYMFLKNHRYIFLNQELPDNERTMVMAHELGHAVLHRKQNCYFIRNKTLLLTSKTEKEANRFAAELLVPDDLIYRYEGFTIRQISYAEGLNEELLHLKYPS